MSQLSMSKLGTLQRILARNKFYIKHLEEEIVELRKAKRAADAHNLIEDEYYFHNVLKSFRAELKTYVAEQQFLKKLMKGQV